MANEKRSLKSSYSSKEADLAPFLNDFWPLEDLSEVMSQRKKVNSPRALLQKVLTEQNAQLENAEAVTANIKLLADDKTFTVTTGHQVCLFGGPMFTLYKIASTIALARDLKIRHPEYQFVPVLWMATEDHDWEEVNHYFPKFGEKRTYEADVKGPVGRHVINANIEKVFTPSTPSWLKACYTPGKTFADAFRQLMHTLFGKYGLVILDADNKELKQVFEPAMEKELLGTGIGPSFLESTKALKDLGYKTQVYPRDINLFHLGNGDRLLIEKREGSYTLKGTEISHPQSEIIAALRQNPEDFSPNVAFRAMYQESILPNIAYIGGWAEVSYWMQFKAGFDQLGIPFPIVIPRLHATFLSEDQLEEWKDLGFEVEDLAKPLHQLYDDYVARNWDNSELEAATSKVLDAYGELAEMLGEIDPTRKISMLAEQKRRSRVMQKLEKKVKKSLRNKQPQPYRKIRELKNAIEPENASQQRVLNFTGINMEAFALIQRILDAAEPQNLDAKWITLA